MLLAQEWSRLPENQLLFEKRFPNLPPIVMSSSYPSCFGWVHEYLQTDYSEPARIIRCRDASILMWPFPHADGFVDYLLFPFTAAMNGLGRDKWRISIMPFIKSFDKDTGISTFQFNNLKHKYISSRRPLYYIGGRDNFLHWLVDHLALALVPGAQKFLHKSTLVTGKLTSWQRDTLSFFGIKNEVIELIADDNAPTFFHFDTLIVSAGFPLIERFRALRSRFALLHGRSTVEKRNVYLSRGAMRPRHRVSNEDEVAAFLMEKGFLVVYPEQLSMAQVASYCFNADIIVTAPGSSSGNFFAFSNNDSILIHMVPEIAKGDPGYAQATVGYANLLVFADRLLTVFGRASGPSSGVRGEHDAEEHFDIDELTDALNKAHSVRAQRLGLTKGARPCSFVSVE